MRDSKLNCKKKRPAPPVQQRLDVGNRAGEYCYVEHLPAVRNLPQVWSKMAMKFFPNRFVVQCLLIQIDGSVQQLTLQLLYIACKILRTYVRALV